MSDKNDILFGMDGWERIEMSFDSALERILEDNFTKAGEPLSDTLDNIEFPIRLLIYKRVDIPKPEMIASVMLEDLYEWLDEERADPDGCGKEPTKAVQDAAKAFADIVHAEYVPWSCEPTGAYYEVDREYLEKDMGAVEGMQSGALRLCEKKGAGR